MKAKMIAPLMLLALCATVTAAAGAAPEKAPTPPEEIRKVDFLNFSYRSPLCSHEYQGFGKDITVTNGEFKSGAAYFAVEAGGILYADLTADGVEEAIVPIECGAVGANFSRTEVHVYAMKNGSVTALADLSDKVLERDYRKTFHDTDSYWGVAEEFLAVKDGNLLVDVLAGGPHAAPSNVVTLEYHVRGKALRLVGKPVKRSATQ